MRRLLGVGCALALALGAGVSPARAQLLGLPPVIVPVPPPVIVPAPPPVIVPAPPLVIAPAPPPTVVPSLIEDKVDPALRTRMQADPLALLPVIVEMQPPLPPFVPGVALGSPAAS